MNKWLLTLLLILFSSGTAWGGSEKLVPSDTSEPDWSWAVVGLGGGPVVHLTDGNDAKYIEAPDVGVIARYFISNETTIPVDATIDSVKSFIRAKESAANAKYRIRWRSDGTTNFCDGTNQALTTSWVDYTDKLTLFPSAGGTCANSLTKARIDSLQLQFNATQGSTTKKAQITECSLYVYWAEAATGDVSGIIHDIDGLKMNNDINGLKKVHSISLSPEQIHIYREASWAWGRDGSERENSRLTFNYRLLSRMIDYNWSIGQQKNHSIIVVNASTLKNKRLLSL